MPSEWICIGLRPPLHGSNASCPAVSKLPFGQIQFPLLPSQFHKKGKHTEALQLGLGCMTWCRFFPWTLALPPARWTAQSLGLRARIFFRHSGFVSLQAVQHGCEFTVCLKPVRDRMALAASCQMKFAGALLDLSLREANCDTNDDSEAIARGTGLVGGFAWLFHSLLEIDRDSVNSLTAFFLHGG